METVALASLALMAMVGPIVGAVLLLRRGARAAQRKLDDARDRVATALGFSLEQDDAIVGPFEGRFVRIVWSFRTSGAGGARPVTYCERPFEQRLGLHLALSTGWPWGGRKRRLPEMRDAVSLRCDSRDLEGALVTSIAPVANGLPRDVTLEIDDATIRLFAQGHTTDVEPLKERLRFAIRLEDAVSGTVSSHGQRISRKTHG